ncbi:hypothetical protein E2C01_087139 [Portunus trituberculatus]|uniref:Uncharacterized protein n=1 Tax=Portunus trituberculatus TaxID=210409 RepID=A0A5B7JFD1_PORTR|nr:hypothetical protein [Portunus trituberculatus]
MTVQQVFSINRKVIHGKLTNFHDLYKRVTLVTHCTRKAARREVTPAPTPPPTPPPPPPPPPPARRTRLRESRKMS